jgi:hypothetical protein
MTILPPANPAVPAPRIPAQELPPPLRQQLARDALAGSPITELARDHDVSRKFVYQQLGKAEQAIADAFAPNPPAEDRVLFTLPVTERWLQRFILALLLNCHSSYRGILDTLRDVVHCPRSLGYLHHVAHQAMQRARCLNHKQDLSAVDNGAHDELFQSNLPVLVGVDVHSTFCYLLSLEEHRDALTWGVRLLELQERGFAPRALIGDSGTGLRAGQALALPGIPCRSDVFHVLRELTPVVNALEKRAYEALTACAKLERQQAQSEHKKGRRDLSTSQKLRHAVPAAAAAVALADDVATLVGWLRRDILALAGPDHAERIALYDFVVAELRTRAPQCAYRLEPLCTYLVNQRDDVLAFAQQLDVDLSKLAEDFQVSVELVRGLLQVQEMDLQDRRRWPRETTLRQQLGGKFYELSVALAAVARRTVRASSVVENLNSRLRNYFFLRRQLGSDYLHLLQFYLNHRCFPRSEHPERVGRSPAELLTGQQHAHWLELLGLPDPLSN